MKKSLLLILPALMLASCGGNSIDKNATKGVIDCYQVRVTNGGSTVFSGDYYISSTEVYEYKNASGKCLYTSNRYRTYNYDYTELLDGSVKVYPSRYKSDFEEYQFSKFVGYLTYETNYLLDLDARIIDTETKYSEYLYSTNPNEGNEANNKEAYEKAKKGYYTINSGTIRLDMAEKEMERHTYTKLGEDCVITYKAKWY